MGFQQGNVFGSGRFGFGVGIPDFLASEESKVAAYYRAIEKGLPVAAFGNGGRFYGVFGEGFRFAPAGGQFFSPSAEFRGGTGQMQFFPLGFVADLVGGEGTATARVLRHLKATGPGNTRTGGVVMQVSHPIVAQDAYREAYEQYEPLKREQEAVDQIFRNTGFVTSGRGNVINNQKFTRFQDQRFRRPASVSSATLQARVGFLSGGATSGYTGSLALIDKAFQRELVQINRILAKGLAEKVAEIQKEKIKRKATSSGRLIDATLNVRNRFPQ